MNLAGPKASFTASAAAIQTIGVVGSGAMGQGIAQLFASAGYSVLLHDIDVERSKAAAANIGRLIDREAAKGAIAADDAVAIKGRISIVAGHAELTPADVIIEAIVEDLAAKRRLFEELEELIDPNCILATNTSSLLVTAIAATAQRPERICGLHFFNPVPLMKVVEVIAGVKTAPQVVDALQRLIKSTGHATVVATDTPGFLINHAGRGLYTEGLRIVSEGIAPFHDVDLIMREAASFRMGPFQLFDLTGLDVSFKVMTQVYHQFFEEPRFRPTPLAERQHAAGLFGRKVGQGFYTYKDGKPLPIVHDRGEKRAARPIWILPSDDGRSDKLTRRLTELGLKIETGAKPGSESIILTTPLGDDATATAVAAGLPPERSFAVDTLFDLDRRMTVMMTPVTQPEYRDSLRTMLADANAAATFIHDSAGFVAQRMVATIVNIGCDIAQQRIASPADIDLGVSTGLAYPHGPLAMGDAIGATAILTILDRMHAFYRDPRYRPSPWLKRRAMLGVPLTTPEASL